MRFVASFKRKIYVEIFNLNQSKTLYLRPRMKTYPIVLLAFTFLQVTSIKMILYLGQNQGPKCFYQYLKIQEKFAFNIKTFGHQKYKIDIYREQGHKWIEVYSKEAPTSFEAIHKLAQAQATHMFCIANIEEGILKAQVQIMGGLQLGSLQSLPSKDDHGLLDQQIGWIQHQKQRLIQAINRVDENQSNAEALKSSSSKTLLLLAILGLIAVVGINYLFYIRARGTLKERKLI